MRLRWYHAAIALLVGAYFRDEIMGLVGQDRATRGVKRKLPIAKNLRTIPDYEGNYDMDGVSFDTEGVIVSSDQHKNIVAPI